jgi:hypothetical protein
MTRRVHVELPSPEHARAIAAGPYGVDVTVDHVGTLSFEGYDWSHRMKLSEFLSMLGVPPKVAMSAEREAAYTEAMRVLTGSPPEYEADDNEA